MPRPKRPITNAQVANRFREAARLLEERSESPFRINAYLRAADTVENLDESIGAFVEDKGREGLMSLPGVGRGTAEAIEELQTTGRWTFLERLRGERDPVSVLQTIPGVGPAFARKLHQALKVGSLEELETAAHDGRLEALPGIGARRVELIRTELAAMLRGRARRRVGGVREARPGVELLLSVDEEYREKANKGTLPRIAPKRFNPKKEAWLPILRLKREGWRFTALFSNTALAHRLGRERDWVVIYFSALGYPEEEQCTVTTETHGELAGRRVVRGRERECLEFYRIRRKSAA